MILHIQKGGGIIPGPRSIGLHLQSHDEFAERLLNVLELFTGVLLIPNELLFWRTHLKVAFILVMFPTSKGQLRVRGVFSATKRRVLGLGFFNLGVAVVTEN